MGIARLEASAWLACADDQPFYSSGDQPYLPTFIACVFGAYLCKRIRIMWIKSTLRGRQFSSFVTATYFSCGCTFRNLFVSISEHTHGCLEAQWMDSGYGRVPLHNIPFSEFRYQISRRLLLGGAKSGPVSCIPTLVSCQYPASVLPITLLHNFVNSISTVILHFALTCTIDLAEGVGCLGVVFFLSRTVRVVIFPGAMVLGGSSVRIV